MQGQSSRHIPSTTMDAVECMITNNDLELENDVTKRDDNRKNKSRRDQRSYENSSSRSARRSPPSVTRKHPSSPIPSSSSRSRNHHSSSQKYHRNSSPSPPPLPPPPPPPPASSSRYHQSTRPIPPAKRAYSPSDSSRERRQPTHRSRTDLSSEKSNEHISTFSSTIQETKIPTKQEKADLSLISEDESTKKSDIRNSTAIIQSSPLPTNNGLHPVSILNESLLDTSIPPSECELSLFAKSTLSNPNTSSHIPSTNNFMRTLEVIDKYRTISTSRGISNIQVDVWLKEIPSIIQKQIDLQKIELDVREREIKLRERELVEREKRFQEKSTENTAPTFDYSEPITAPTKEERTPVKSEIINHDIVNISPEESVVKTISSITDNANPSPPPTVTRKAGGKSRFSPIEINPSISSSDEPPNVELYSNDFIDNQSSTKKSIEPILAPYAELKVTSSSTSRKVEIQSGNSDSTVTKSSSQDLRLTLSKNRSKYSSNDDEETIEISPTNSDEKQSSGDDYQSQRSITSTPMESDVRRHRQQYPSNSYNHQRSYNHGSSSKYGSNQKRGENADLRSRLYEQKNSKSSRSTYKNTH